MYRSRVSCCALAGAGSAASLDPAEASWSLESVAFLVLALPIVGNEAVSVGVPIAAAAAAAAANSDA